CPVNGVHQFGNPLQRKKLALDGHQYGVGGDEGVQGEQVQSGRTVDEDKAVILSDFRNALAKAEFAVGDVHEFQVGADQVLVCRYEMEPLKIGLHDCSLGRD